MGNSSECMQASFYVLILQGVDFFRLVLRNMMSSIVEESSGSYSTYCIFA